MVNDIEGVLGRLKKQSNEELAKLVYTGMACSRSDTHLHLAVSSGVVMIPLSEIDSIAPVNRGFDQDVLYVLVKDAGKVKHALRREQLRDSGTTAADDKPGDHFLHSTLTTLDNPPFYADACDATDVQFDPESFSPN